MVLVKSFGVGHVGNTILLPQYTAHSRPYNTTHVMEVWDT